MSPTVVNIWKIGSHAFVPRAAKILSNICRMTLTLGYAERILSSVGHYRSHVQGSPEMSSLSSYEDSCDGPVAPGLASVGTSCMTGREIDVNMHLSGSVRMAQTSQTTM